MTFIVEDGTGIAGANSYQTVEEFKAYHADRGNDISAITDPTGIQNALVAATDYIERRWGPLFLGLPLWPTTMPARVTFDMPNNPTAGQQLTLGSTTYIAGTDFDIKPTAQRTLLKLYDELASQAEVTYLLFLDFDVASMVIYTEEPGVAVSTTIGNAVLSSASTTGESLKTQPLSFPRKIGGMCKEIKFATAEYALRAASAPLAPDPSHHESGRAVIASTEKVDEIEESYRFSEVQRITKPYPAADSLLRGLVRAGGGVIR